MDNQSIAEMNHCLLLIYRLEDLAKRDAEEMDRCTRGPVLTEYRLTMDKQVQRLQRMERMLKSML